MTETMRDRRDLGAFIPARLDDYPLNPYEFRLYTHIVRRVGKCGCFESVPSMAKHCQMNEKTTRKALALLMKANLIDSEARSGTTTVYGLTPDSEWIKPEQLSLLRGTTPTKSGGTTPTKSGGTTPTKSGGTTPTKSGGTPLPDQEDKGSNTKEIQIKGIQIKEEETSLPAKISNVEVLDPEPVHNFEPYIEQKNQSYSGEQTNPDQGQFSAAEPENLKILQEAQAIAYDWRKRPWMLNAIEFKPETSTSVWMSNMDFYSLPNGSPNYKKINDRLKKLDDSLKGIGKQAAIAYVELTNYWKTASSLTNPGGGVNAEQYKSVAKQVQTQTKRDSRLAEMDAALKNY